MQFHHAISIAVERFDLGPSSHHGPSHWARVLENGLRLTEQTGADPLVVNLFAIFHDCCRKTDGIDPFHGGRACKFINELDLGLSKEQYVKLQRAMSGHTNNFHDVDPTVGTCWDADRLDICRVGVAIDPTYFSTEAAQDPDIIAWAQARGEYGQVPEFANLYVYGDAS